MIEMTRREALTFTTAGIVAAGATAVHPAMGQITATTSGGIDSAPNGCDVYPNVPSIDCIDFQLPPGGLPAEQHQDALRQLLAYQTIQRRNAMGFQANQRLDYEEDLQPFLNFHINNVGDPFQSGNFTINSKWMERAVLDYYARLWHAKYPHDPEDPETYWGYVLTMGSTEGNLYGLWNGRDYLAGKCLLYDPHAAEEARAASRDGRERCVPVRITYQQPQAPRRRPHAFTPVAFFSEDTHYSVIKAVTVLGISTFYEIGTECYPHDCPLHPGEKWPREVPSQGGGGGPGSIDIDALVKLVEFFAARGYPILLNLNYGTTFKGAYDDVQRVGERLMPIFKRYGLDERTIYYKDGHRVTRSGFWIHVDAALAASYMPFIEMAHAQDLIATRGPNFDFRLPYVHSLTMSGHKWIGAPWPCGVYMSRTKQLLLPPSRPRYIGSRDSTLAGSRNGFSAMILWNYLAKHSYQQQMQQALALEHRARYAFERLKALEEERCEPLWVQRTPLSLTIRFKRASDDLVFKYTLSNETLYVEGEKRDYSHIFVMEHVTEDLIDALIEDLRRPDAFAPPRAESTVTATQMEPFTLPDARQLAYLPMCGRGWK